jgi:hypothetical protein
MYIILKILRYYVIHAILDVILARIKIPIALVAMIM